MKASEWRWTVEAGISVLGHVRSVLIQKRFALKSNLGLGVGLSEAHGRKKYSWRFSQHHASLACMDLSSQSDLDFSDMRFYFKLAKHGFLCV